MQVNQKNRNEIPAQYKWELEHIFQTEAHWREAVSSITVEAEAIKSFEGKLTTGEALLACLNKYFSARETVSRIYAYAYMKKSEDSTVPASQGMADIAESTYVEASAASAFIAPEILNNDEATIQNFIATTPGLKLYEHYLNNIIREKAHVLSAEIEEVLANAEEMAGAAENIYSMLESADMKFGKITGENGDEIEITHGRFITLMKSPDRRVRKDAFETYYDSFGKLKNTLAVMLNSSIKKDIFFASTRKYASTLDAELSDSNIPRAVYIQLIEAVHEFLPAMHRYMSLRKKALKVDELHMYDIYTPLVEKADAKIPYEEAKKMIVKGLAPLGKDYLSAMEKGMDSGWIDVYENAGKESGAYAYNVYGVHPYVLLNHEDTISDMFTLAHEMGHAMHDYYFGETQPNVYASSTTFLAEVASTVNETIMIEHMLNTTTDPKTRAYLIGEYLEQFRGSVFRQVMFAEFEMIIHSMAEEDEPLTLEALSRVYRELNVKYHGPDMIIDEQIDLEWARIEHFYSAFYVYQYATGYAAALAFTKRLQSGDPKMLEDYLGFLKSGSSDYSINILKKAGVDMSTPTPVREALKVFEGLVGEMEKIFE